MAQNTKGAGVATTHPEYDCNICRWIQVDDVVEAKVKEKGTTYLPKPNSQIDKCAPDQRAYYEGDYFNEAGYNYACAMYQRDVTHNNTRYGQYKERALFYNFTKRTKDGMIGAIFRKDPKVMLPDELQYLTTNVDGNNTDLDQQSRVVLDQVLRKGREFLLVDMPAMQGDVSQADNQSAKPYIQKYDAQNVINWRVQNLNGVMRVVMVVLREFVDVQDRNLFDHEYECQYRVLMINTDGYYEQRIYKEDDNFEVIPIRVNGQQLTYIPGYFIGSEENDYSVDAAPLYDLSEVNIAHYRNSADNEESSFICGQPTLVLSPSRDLGSPQQFAEANPNGVMIGSRSGINMGEGGSAAMLQAAENNLAKQNMLDKEQQAIAIGAQLITPTVNQTAEAARIQQGADTSVLAAVAKNVSDAYTDALNMCGRFLGIVPIDDISEEIEYELNTDFFLEILTPQERAQWVAEINTSILPKSAYYDRLRKTGQIKADATDEDISSMIEEEGGEPGGLI
ncbi:coil containing protein [Vibrio phage LP.2]|nr:coil containing protein [Vibrio phage LP.2]